MKKRLVGALAAVFLSCFGSLSSATTFPLPSSKDAMLGNLQYSTSSFGDTVVSIMQQYNLGVNAVEDANPQVNFGYALRSGIHLTIPSAFLLPPLPRKGIVINLAEMRMYYYPGNGVVKTYPIGIGKVGKTIPLAMTRITHKTINPKWTPPQDIREYNQQQGVELPEVMGAGPDNPLGPYAIYLGVPTYLIHSTIFPDSVGRRASFGCIRMNEHDIKEFFPEVKRNTPVAIVNMPVKAGWVGNKLYLEAHPALDEHSDMVDNTLPGVVEIVQAATQGRKAIIDWQLVSRIEEIRDGVPHEIGISAAG